MALTTLADLRAELLARGANYIDASGTVRQDQYLNQAYLEICEEELWPFLEATATGAAPLTISDLRSLLSVYESTGKRQLAYQDRRSLQNDYGDLTITGSPFVYFITTGSAVATFPVGGTLEVRYIKVPAELSGPTDQPVLPLRYRNLIVDGAMRRVYQDSDNFQAAAAIEEERQAGLNRMRQSLLWQNNAATEFVAVADGSDW